MKTIPFPDDSASSPQPNATNPGDPNASAANEEETLSDSLNESDTIEEVGKKITRP
jgi:hypothetical protein